MYGDVAMKDAVIITATGDYKFTGRQNSFSGIPPFYEGRKIFTVKTNKHCAGNASL